MRPSNSTSIWPIKAFTSGYLFGMSKRHSYSGCGHPTPHPSGKWKPSPQATILACLRVTTTEDAAIQLLILLADLSAARSAWRPLSQCGFCILLKKSYHFFSPTQPYSLFHFSCSSHSCLFLYPFSFFRISVGNNSFCCSALSKARLPLSPSLTLFAQYIIFSLLAVK